MIVSPSTFRAAVVLGLGLSLIPTTTRAGFVLTAEAAGIQSSQVSGVTTETFKTTAVKNFTSLTTEVGTVTSSSLAILTADTFGGADGKGKYAAIGSESGALSATLTLNAAASYFGFWWSAADANNVVEFLSKGSVIASLDAKTALANLSSDYNKNPNDGSNGGEKYVYLNVYGTNGTAFDQVRFSNLNYGTGFETDNWSVRSGTFTPPYSGTAIGGVVNAGAVPEPSSLALVAIGSFGWLGFHLRRGRAAR